MQRFGFVPTEISKICSLQSAVLVDGSVDFGVRKNEAIFDWFVAQALHFTELEELLRFLHFGFAFGKAGGLQGLERNQVLLEVAIDALLVEGQELELF